MKIFMTKSHSQRSTPQPHTTHSNKLTKSPDASSRSSSASTPPAVESIPPPSPSFVFTAWSTCSLQTLPANAAVHRHCLRPPQTPPRRHRCTPLHLRNLHRT